MINNQREAKYTEYLGEYLLTHSLPEEFNQIDGFADLFTATYVDREIGFETEELFEIKLSARAHDVIPLYKQRMEQYQNAINNLQTAKKTFKDEIQVSPKKVSNTELPLNTTSALPNSVQEAVGYTDVTTRTEEGVTTIESYDILDRLKSKVYNITNDLLGEFDSLFMGVF